VRGAISNDRPYRDLTEHAKGLQRLELRSESISFEVSQHVLRIEFIYMCTSGPVRALIGNDCISFRQAETFERLLFPHRKMAIWFAEVS